jgi:CheY-like chemotaxis protein
VVLRGKRALIVEDEALLALSLQDMLADMGCAVVATKARLRDALIQAERADFDFAVLDVNLAGERIDPVADILARRAIPFIFATGYNEPAMPGAHRDRHVIGKPYSSSELQAALLKCLT